MPRGGKRPGWSALRRARSALFLALIPGILGALLVRWPPAEGLERDGLDLLFKVRGVRAAPSDVCVVAIDRDSHEELGVDDKLTWPRVTPS
jgi:CHASE2 domain-containing sensor protein